MNRILRIPVDWPALPALPAFALLFAALLAGCGNLTAGGFGEATVLVTGDGDEPSTTASQPHAPSMSWVGADAPSAVSSPLGHLEIELQVFVRGPNGPWSELTDGAQPMTLAISGGSSEELVSGPIEEGAYAEVRVIFHSVEAEVTGGLEIDGIPILGRVRVRNTAPIVVEREAGLEVDDGQALEILVDLNAGAWLPTASTIGLEVSVEAFQAAVELTSRVGS